MSSNVRRALRILELLAPHPEGLRIRDLAEAMSLNKAIPHRLLAELVELGYVSQEEASERYHATFKLGALGLQQVEHAGIHNWAEAVLERLAAKTHELVRLAVVTGRSLHWIAKAQGSNSTLIVDPASGADVALHATATGKAWLSTLDRGDVDAVLDERGMRPLTAATIVDRDALLAEIADVRRRGFAMVEEEIDVGVSAIASPIFEDGSKVAVGTVSIAGPTSRLPVERLERWAPDLFDTAAELGRLWPAYHYGSTVARRA
jgi:DNA-binding IclR family transcriptional regulator